MNALLLNIGNTHTHQTLWSGNGPEHVETILTSQVLKSRGRTTFLTLHPSLPVLAACVVPKIARALHDAWPGRTLFFLDAAMAPFPDFSRVDASTLGADRVANAVGALCCVLPPVVILDAGTAVTTEVIDSQGVFRGGAIAPGRQLLVRALHRGTAQLPEIPLTEQCSAPLGANTVDAIRAGVDTAFLGMVEKLVNGSRQYLGVPACPILVTGGDREFCCRYVPGLQPAPKHLALHGLARVAADLFAAPSPDN